MGTPAKFQTRQQHVEAVQLTKPIAFAALSGTDSGPFDLQVFGQWNSRRGEVHCAYVIVDTQEGEKRANLGDWIVKDSGGFWICDDETFQRKFEPETA